MKESDQKMKNNPSDDFKKDLKDEGVWLIFVGSVLLIPLSLLLVLGLIILIWSQLVK